MRSKKILILGASRYYSRCIEGARQAGYYVIVVDRNPHSDGFRYADESAICDIVDKEGILTIAMAHGISAIVPINDYGVPTAAYVAEKMGLLGISSEVAILATDKEAMRRRWIETGVPCPKSAIAENESEFRQAIAEVGLPCILKPAHGIGGASRGVIVLEKEDEIPDAISFSQQFYSDKKTLVESFVQAEVEHSVEVLIRDGRAQVIAVSDKIKTALPYRVDKAVLYPSRITGERLTALKQTVVDSVLALGITNGVAHVELASTPDGFVLFEIGARCGGGGTANPIVKHSSGVDQFTEFVRILAGDEPGQLEPDRVLGCCYYFITPATGEVESISGFDDVLSSEGILDADLFFVSGSHIQDVTIGTERSGFIISTGQTATEALERAERAEQLMSIQYKQL